MAVWIESIPLRGGTVECLDDPDIHQQIEIPADRLAADASELGEFGLIELAVWRCIEERIDDVWNALVFREDESPGRMLIPARFLITIGVL